MWKFAVYDFTGHVFSFPMTEYMTQEIPVERHLQRRVSQLPAHSDTVDIVRGKGFRHLV